MRPAAQLLSNRVSILSSIVFPNQPKISAFFRILNNGFDALNSKIPIDKKNHLKSGYGMKLFDQDKALNELKLLMEKIRFYTKKKNLKQALLPCQKGFIISINSFKSLREYLKQKFGVHYVLGTRVNQDLLECFFSMIRAAGGSNNTPSPVDFRYRIRLLILGAQPRRPNRTNCEMVEDLNFIASEILNQRPPKPQKKPKSEEPQETPAALKAANSSYKLVTDGDFEVESESLKFIAGYLAWHLKKNGKGVFGTPTGVMKLVSNERNGTWIQMLSNGGLLLPNDEILTTVKASEKVFCEVTQNIYIENIKSSCRKVILERFPDFNQHIVQEFVKLRIRIRLKVLNEKKKNFKNSKKAKQFSLSRTNFKSVL